MDNTQQTVINAIRILSVDAIQKANSGHPGLPMGAATIGFSVFNQMNINPKNPKFINRDRFILSAGHGSMLNYALLNLFGFNLPMEEIKNFRQFGSKTPGHPEYGVTDGVETSTGPLGQGVANAVGFALAESFLANKFNRGGYPVVDHYTYAIAGDGCMQEGIEYEAASLAGTLKLNKLILLYDKNNITIEGDINTAFSEDVGKRHEAQGWQVIYVADGQDVDAITNAINEAKADENRPSLIICRTEIGYKSPLEGKAGCHGAPLGAENIEKYREALGWKLPPFELPSECDDFRKSAQAKGEKAEKEYNEMYAKYKKEFPELEAELQAWLKNEIPDLSKIDGIWDFDAPDATRNCGNAVLNKISKVVPNIFGGSADLEPANKSKMKSFGFYSAEDRSQQNIHFGIREHSMGAICNGIALHGGLNPYCATFLVFTDYMRNAMRMSALMNLPVTFIMTHDSIGVGEDGPTHEPIEHLASLRAMPNMRVFRPADGKETVAGFITAFDGKNPTTLVLSRQNLPQYQNSGANALKGGYVLEDCDGAPDVILMASGSEVEQIVGAKKLLAEKGVKARVVSMPCMELFDAQSAEYKESVLPKCVTARVAVEAAVAMPWYKYVGINGGFVTMETFGASAPAKVLFNHFGFTAENVAAKAVETIAKLK
ncbi:MAG: transketolase [Clostridia bacterium]